MKTFPGKVGVQQRVLPFYRNEFFDELAGYCEGGLSIFAGEPQPDEGINVWRNLEKAQFTRGRNYHLLNPNSKFYLCWQGGLIKWLKNWQPDVLIIEANPRYMNTKSAINWMHQHDRKVVGWGLGAPEITGYFSNVRRRLREKFLRNLDAIIAYSSKGAQEYRKSCVPADRIYIATNAVSHAPSGDCPQRVRAPNKLLSVLFIGRIQPRKRIDNLIRACSKLPDEIKPSLVIIGDGPEREKCINLAKEIYPETVFPGALMGEELQRYFLEADLFVLPGTGGLAAQQAMTFGLPVIMAEGDGTQSDLIGENNGWLVAPGNLEELIDTLTIALSDDARLRSMGKNAFMTIKEKINIECMSEVFIETLLSVMH